MKKVDDPERSDIYELESSGRRFYAYGGVIGLNEDMDHPGYGFDGQLPGDPAVCDDPDDPEPDWRPLTEAERRELAEEMVRRWKAWGGLT